MNIVPEDKQKAAVYGGVVLVLLLAAAYFAFARGGEPKPDAEAQAAADRSAEMSAAMQKTQPAVPDLPVESRAPRGGAVAPGR